MPDSERLTLSTSARLVGDGEIAVDDTDAAHAREAIAIAASVTVSMAAETTGIRSSSERVKRVVVATSFGGVRLRR